ncbi:MAG: cysteine--tRNA ligase [Ponticaulis sp.]|nr:cysteine--tRNA ligase [Ponticaulis sp.]|tara:strand:- start:187409 stop:188797 length:1389 start_codon:yes stop_codon:yes gene_type:complete
MTLRLYDTMAREKRVFEPQDPARVTLYVCGPTVYNYAHIGNARPPVVFDTLRRLLGHIYGPDAVVYARNITDVEDKIIARSNETGESIADITKKYADIYNADMASLGVRAPDIEPWATQHIDGMIKIGESLERKGYAYVTKDGLYFQVDQMDDYGKLSGRKQDDNEAGARVAVDEGKRSPADFAIWKFAKEGEPDEAIWDSPWGRGRPGWHIECSAMIKAELGDTIDIHGGGIDLTFPHHENEIAQSECAHGETLANYWMHNGFLDMEGEKMSKSLGNVKLVHDLVKDWPGEVLRYALLSGHYRAPLDWTRGLLEQSKTSLDRIYGALRRVWGEGEVKPDDRHGVREKLMDDLNTPLALAELHALASEANKAADEKNEAAMLAVRNMLVDAGEALGLLSMTPTEWEHGGDADETARIDALVQARLDARKNKDWAEADRIRDTLKAEGIEIMDGAGGSTWRRV